MLSVSPLKKITVYLHSLDEHGNNVTKHSASLSFIYGVGSDGLCPLENMLANKLEGQEVELALAQNRRREILGHLYNPVMQTLQHALLPYELRLKIVIDSIAEASHREIVTAMAGSLSSGCGNGSCDCGCG